MDTPTLLQSLLSQHKMDVVGAIVLIISLTILLAVAQQTLFKNPNEPPVVFHWLPVIGSTVTYGIDPFRFFFDCQAKVCGYMHFPDLILRKSTVRMLTLVMQVWRYIYIHSPWQKGYRLSWIKRQSVHLERKAQGCQC